MICGLSGGVDSAVAAVLIHEAIGDQLTCVFVDHGLMRAGRGRGGGRACSAAISTFRSSMSTRPRRSSPRLRGSPTPRPSARRSAGSSSRPSSPRREASPTDGGPGRISRPRHALSRRDRDRVVLRRPVGDDQVPPQCRRPARADEHEAGRAVARTLQGRSARARAASSACPSASSAATRFPAPASPSACPARVTREKLDILRQADAIYLEEIRTAGLYDRSGRPSRCCCR